MRLGRRAGAETSADAERRDRIDCILAGICELLNEIELGHRMPVLLAAGITWRYSLRAQNELHDVCAGSALLTNRFSRHHCVIYSGILFMQGTKAGGLHPEIQADCFKH